MDDPAIEYFADQYRRNRVEAHGIPFWLYLRDPAKFDLMALEPEPLLPAQQDVARRMSA